MKLVVPGGSGQVGQIIARAFAGDEVVILSRGGDGTPGTRTVEWDGRPPGAA